MPLCEPQQKPFSALNWEGGIKAFARRTDWWTPLILCVLSVWSVLAIYSVNSLKTPEFFEQEFVCKQIVYIGIGWGAYWAVALVEPRVVERWAWVIYAAGILLLLPVAACALLKININPFIVERYGARRWIVFPMFSVQPSEFTKVSTLAVMALTVGRGVSAAHLSRVEKIILNLARHVLGWRPWARLGAPLVRSLPLLVRMAWLAALPFGLIFIQPDLGSALTYIPMVFALLVIANVPLRFFALLGVLTLPVAGALAVDMTQYAKALQTSRMNLSETAAHKNPASAIRGSYKGLFPIRNHQRERIMTLFAPQLIDPDGGGTDWQPRQARMAVARGELLGQGFLNGSVVRHGWLPPTAAHNDFLFSCIAEEHGFVGGVSLIGLFALLIMLALRTAVRARDRFGASIAIGTAVLATVHVMVNIGMNIGIMPVTGVSLPFLSYGGSFILSCFLLFGMVQGVRRSSQPLQAPARETANLVPPVQLAGRTPV
ncbi:MAG: rod shape-determining protein RodA [Puniceicoccales bacterium]|jgi:rod shape determining protein RodA|nr:rod shape-determining protein RodA [Puniceicoccales bacterium]